MNKQQYKNFIRCITSAAAFLLILPVIALNAVGCSYVNQPTATNAKPTPDTKTNTNADTNAETISAPTSTTPESPDITPVTKSAIHFDTVISVTLYGLDMEKYIDECFNIADRCEKLFSKSIEDSDIARVNNSDLGFVTVSKETIDIIKMSERYSEMSDGKFSLVCGALTFLWDEKRVPEKKEIEAAMTLTGDDMIEINEEKCQIRIKEPGVKLDFGAVAKGYIADRMKEYLISQGVGSGIISLGGNILLIGSKPVLQGGNAKESLYTIGIYKPFSEDNEMIKTLKLADTSVVTSGNYQRYFEENGKLYHHIIDLTTGYPAESGLNSVSVICSSSFEADIMSTILYLEGFEKGTQLAESLGIEAIFVSSENTIL